MDTMLKLNDIRTNGGTQPRAQLSQETIEEYAAEMREGRMGSFPALTVFYDGEAYWLADGFHRWHAAQRAGFHDIHADVRQGTLADAQWFSFGVNKSHGLRRSNQDKQNAIQAALQHPNGAGLSNRQIADHCGVDHSTVGDWRKKLEEAGGIPQSTERKTANGKTMNTTKIASSNASRATAKPAPAPARPAPAPPAATLPTAVLEITPLAPALPTAVLEITPLAPAAPIELLELAPAAPASEIAVLELEPAAPDEDAGHDEIPLAPASEAAAAPSGDDAILRAAVELELARQMGRIAQRAYDQLLEPIFESGQEVRVEMNNEQIAAAARAFLESPMFKDQARQLGVGAQVHITEDATA